MLLDIDDLQVVAALELLLADAPEVGDRRGSSGACAGDKKPEQILRQIAS